MGQRVFYHSVIRVLSAGVLGNYFTLYTAGVLPLSYD